MFSSVPRVLSFMTGQHCLLPNSYPLATQFPIHGTLKNFNSLGNLTLVIGAALAQVI
jgi:hypothetical protein